MRHVRGGARGGKLASGSARLLTRRCARRGALLRRARAPCATATHERAPPKRVGVLGARACVCAAAGARQRGRLPSELLRFIPGAHSQRAAGATPTHTHADPCSLLAQPARLGEPPAAGATTSLLFLLARRSLARACIQLRGRMSYYGMGLYGGNSRCAPDTRQGPSAAAGHKQNTARARAPPGQEAAWPPGSGVPSIPCAAVHRLCSGGPAGRTAAWGPGGARVRRRRRRCRRSARQQLGHRAPADGSVGLCPPLRACWAASRRPAALPSSRMHGAAAAAGAAPLPPY
jgi:hypothetical protein